MSDGRGRGGKKSRAGRGSGHVGRGHGGDAGRGRGQEFRYAERGSSAEGGDAERSSWGDGRGRGQGGDAGRGRGGDAGRGRGGNAGRGRGGNAGRGRGGDAGRGRGGDAGRGRGGDAGISSWGDAERRQGDRVDHGQSSSQSLDQPQQVQPPAGAATSKAELQIVQRKGGLLGTAGRKIVVTTNHFPLTINPKIKTAYHYDVTITPDKPKKLMSLIMNKFKANHFPKIPIAFDEVKNLYSAQKLPFKGDIISGEVDAAESSSSKPRIFKVDIKYATHVDLTELQCYFKTGNYAKAQEALQCLDIVLRSAPSAHFTKVGRSFFSPPTGRPIYLGDGLELWHGHFQSAILGWKPFLNIDVAHKGFPIKQNVIDYFRELHVNEYENMKFYIIETASKFLKGCQVEFQIPGQSGTRRILRINGLENPPTQLQFDYNGVKTTVNDYFKNVKRYDIKYKLMPCLWVGDPTKKNCVPPELCTIVPGQARNQKLNPKQTSNMVRQAATSTDVRKAKIMEMMEKARFNEVDCVKAFGLTVGKDFTRVEARVLDPPKLSYKNNSSVPVAKGVWQKGIFKKAAVLNYWTILNMDRYVRNDALVFFAREMVGEAEFAGMKLAPAKQPFETIELRGRDLRPLENYFTKNKQMELIFVVVSDMSDIYSKVKQVAELKVGVLTQCIKRRTLERMNKMIIGNILLKVNTKLKGVNHTISEISRPDYLNTPCIIMGADVTHPSPDQRNIPSIAAVVASYDLNAVQYNTCLRLQPAREEMIQDMEAIVKEQLMHFYIANKCRPHKIIMFRDGVSEGQFSQVLNIEFQAIRRACRSLEENYKPSITFLVVQKRHHTRLFPTNPKDSYDRNFNVPAGTCVDTEIVHPTEREYYLVSHASIQGVARPTKYRVLWDDNNMTEDEIQKLTYYLCHLFSRCTRSVSYPAPTYYAHLSAFRARHHITGKEINMNNLATEQRLNSIKIDFSKENPMFFV